MVQEALGRQILLENVSSYVAFRESTISEWEFLGEVARRADCGILLDVNNIYVSARNHGFSAAAYIAGVPADRVAQFHLAGHSDKGAYLFDSHDALVPARVAQAGSQAAHWSASKSISTPRTCACARKEVSVSGSGRRRPFSTPSCRTLCRRSGLPCCSSASSSSRAM